MGSLSVTVSPSPVRAGVVARFTIRIDPPDAVSALSLDFGDGTTATFGPVHASIDVSHMYRLPGTYNATAVATISRGVATAVVVVRVES